MKEKYWTSALSNWVNAKTLQKKAQTLKLIEWSSAASNWVNSKTMAWEAILWAIFFLMNIALIAFNLYQVLSL